MVRNWKKGQKNGDLGSPCLCLFLERRSATGHGAVAGTCKEPQQKPGFCASDQGPGGHDKSRFLIQCGALQSETGSLHQFLSKDRCLYTWCLLLRSASGVFMLLSSCCCHGSIAVKKKRGEKDGWEKEGGR